MVVVGWWFQRDQKLNSACFGPDLGNQAPPASKHRHLNLVLGTQKIKDFASDTRILGRPDHELLRPTTYS